jgi:hypothetical protein
LLFACECGQLLGASAQPCVFVLCDVELNFQVSVHVLDLFSL